MTRCNVQTREAGGEEIAQSRGIQATKRLPGGGGGGGLQHTCSVLRVARICADVQPRGGQDAEVCVGDGGVVLGIATVAFPGPNLVRVLRTLIALVVDAITVGIGARAGFWELGA